MFENYVILEEVDWEWIILKKNLFEIYIQIVENYTILAEKRLNSRWLNCILVTIAPYNNLPRLVGWDNIYCRDLADVGLALQFIGVLCWMLNLFWDWDFY